MSKKDFVESLTSEQKQKFEVLLDEAYAKGYSSGYTDGQIAKEYERCFN